MKWQIKTEHVENHQVQHIVRSAKQQGLSVEETDDTVTISGISEQQVADAKAWIENKTGKKMRINGQ